MRQALGALDGEFLGHQCQRCPFDDVNAHVEVLIVDRGLSLVSQADQLARLEADNRYRARGFVLDSTEPPPPAWHLPALTGEWCVARLHPRRDMTITFV